jgi:hypothetical protein
MASETTAPYGYFLYETDWRGYGEGTNRPLTRRGKRSPPPPPTQRRWFRTRAEAEAAKAAARAANDSADLTLCIAAVPPPRTKDKPALLDGWPKMSKRLTR